MTKTKSLETLSEKELLVKKEEKNWNRNKWIFSTSGIGRDMLYCLVSTYFLQYVQFGLTLTVVQFTTLYLLIGILGRIWDGINDPMMGAIIDGAHLKWGKFKPWILIGAIADAILTLILFNIRPFNSSVAQGWLYVGVICFVYLLWEATFTMNDIGYWSMIPSLSRTKERRDKMTTLTIFFAGIGTIIMTALVTYLSPGNLLTAYTIFSIIACVSVLGFQTYCAVLIKEAPRNMEEEKKENKVSLKKMFKTIAKNDQLLWMSLALLFSSIASDVLMGLIYNLYYLEIGYDGNVIIFIVIYALANTLIQLLYPPMAKRLGRKKIQLISTVIVLTGYIGLFSLGWGEFIPFNLATLCVFGIMVFVGNTWFYTASLINMSNCVEYNEYKNGTRNESVISTMRPLIVKFSAAIKYLVVTLTLVLSGIYAISQNVSTLETQVSQYKNRVKNTADTLKYIEDVASLRIKQIYGESNESLNVLISGNELLDSCQIRADYLETVTRLYVVEKGENKEQVSCFQINDLIVNNNNSANEDIELTKNKIRSKINLDSSYEVVIQAKGSGNTPLNSVNEVYKSHKTIKTRISLRIAICILPALSLFLSFVLQRKKFIIDENYYEMMMKEIKERKGEEENKVLS